MRPREKELEDSMSEPETVAAPASRIGGILSSMVVRPSASGEERDFDRGQVGALDHRRDSPPDPPAFRHLEPPLSFDRRGSPPPLHRRGSPPTFHRRESPSDFPRRYSPPASRRRGFPTNFHHRSQRLNENQVPKLPGLIARSLVKKLTAGDGTRGGSTSPRSRQRLDDTRYDRDFDRSIGLHFGRGFRGGRGGRRSQDFSPNNGFGRGGKPFGRGYNVTERMLSPSGESVHRSDPNLSPREGDWICRNPSCGNLNFAQKTYCSSCNKIRFGSKHHEVNCSSPQRVYFHSPPPYERNSGPRMDRGRRDMNGYRSHPHHSVEDSRDFRTGSPSPVRGERFRYHTRGRQEYHEEDERMRGTPERPMHEEWNRGDRRRDGSLPDRRVYDQSPSSPRDRWVRNSRERSRSPLGERSMKGSYMGGGRGTRRYDDSHMGHVQGGRGFRQGSNIFRGRGRGDPPGMAHGRRGSMY